MKRRIRAGWAAFCLLSAGAFGLPSASGGEAITLTSARKVGAVDQVAAQLEVGGELKLVGEEGIKTLKMSAAGAADYHEKLLTGDLTAWDQLRLLRQYSQARATIKVEDAVTRPSLRTQRSAVAVAGLKDSFQLFGVDGPLTRDELNLLEFPCNTAILESLLPTKPVSVGDSWEHTPELAAALLGLDAAGAADLKSTLSKVEETTATLALAGTVQGAIDGVSTKIDVKANYRFDRRAGRITFIGMLIKEDRSIGHVGPGMNVTAKFQVKVTPGAQHEALAAYQDASALKSLAPEYALLEYEPSLSNYRLLYDSRWHVMTDEPHLVALRLVDRGELLAQAKISTPAGVSHEQPATIEAFQDEVRETLGDEFGQFTSATTTQNSLGIVTHRVTVSGVVEELPIEWRYYLLIGPAGEQVVAAFTLEEKESSRFGDADERMVESIEFKSTKPAEETAAKATPRLKLK